MTSRNPADVGASSSRHSVPMSNRLVYHSNATPVARKDEFRALLKEIALYLYRFASTKAEKSICQELARGRSLSIDGLDVLCDLAAKSDRPFVLENGIQRTVVQRVAALPSPPLCAFEASRLEQQANETLNLAQLVAAEEDNPAHWGLVAELAAQQEFASDRLEKAAWRRAETIRS